MKSLHPPTEIVSARVCAGGLELRRFLLLICGLIPLFSLSYQVHATVSAVDDTGQVVTLSKPAIRIISTAPNLTEILFHIEAGEQIVAGACSIDQILEAFAVGIFGCSFHSR